MIKKSILLLFSILLQLPLHILYFFSGFFPRDPKIWLFGCWGGNRYRGNSKLLYSYVKENYKDIQIFWITKNRILHNQLKKEGVTVYLAYSLKGYLITLQAKYFFVSHGILDMNQFVSRKGVMINLTHFTYPIKEMLRLPRSLSVFEKMILYLQEPYGYLINPDYVITSSKFTAKSSKFTYGIDEENILPTGTPKSDLLFSLMRGNSKSYSNEKNLSLNPHGKKLIFFLPTIRPNPLFNLFDNNFSIQNLNLLLNEIDGIMLFNFHPSSVIYQTVPDFSPYENMKLLNYKGDEINKMLCQIDLLITDYSSIFSDFLVFNKPIIFAKFDHENYIKTKGGLCRL